MVRKAIEQRGGHLGIAEDAGPFAEAEVGGDDDAGAFVELAEQVDSSAPPDALNGRYPSSSRITRSSRNSRSASWPARFIAFSCSSALTRSTVAKNRTFLR